MDLIDAASVPLVGLTGSLLVDEGVKPHAGDAVLITGAVGSVAARRSSRAKLRRSEGFCGRVRAVRQRSAAESLGVEGVVALDDEFGMLSTFDAIADTVGGLTTERLRNSFDAVARSPERRRRSIWREGARPRGSSRLGASRRAALGCASPRGRRRSARHSEREAFRAFRNPRSTRSRATRRGRQSRRARFPTADIHSIAIKRWHDASALVTLVDVRVRFCDVHASG